MILLGASLVVAVADWFAVARGRKRLGYVLKPLTLALLVAAAAVLGGDEPGLRWQFTLAALVLSLAGDVFLMLPADLFLPGLGSFLLAHVAYIAAINQTPPPVAWTVGASVLMLVVIAPIYRRLLVGMGRSGERAMAVPVAIYALALGAVVVSAVATAGRSDWSAGRSVVIILGAVLSATSDGLIGWTRFVKTYPWAPVAIISTYHLAQIGLVAALLG
ncbi:MAG: lysoplasmalogenase [Actinomycetota bacterium]